VNHFLNQAGLNVNDISDFEHPNWVSTWFRISHLYIHISHLYPINIPFVYIYIFSHLYHFYPFYIPFILMISSLSSYQRCKMTSSRPEAVHRLAMSWDPRSETSRAESSEAKLETTEPLSCFCIKTSRCWGHVYTLFIALGWNKGAASPSVHPAVSWNRKPNRCAWEFGYPL